MADLATTPVANQVQPPAPIGQSLNTTLAPLSSILGIQQQRQQLAGQTAQTQQIQQQNQELQGLATFTKNAAQDPAYHNQDGSLNTLKFQADAQVVAPVYGQQYIGQATSNANAALQNRQALLNLTNSQRSTVGQIFGALAAKPNASAQDYMDAVNQARAVSDDAGWQGAVDRMLFSHPNTANMTDAQASSSVRRFARGIAMSTGAPNASESAPAISTMQGPRGLQTIQTNPQSPLGIGPQGAPMPQGVPPSGQVVQDSLGRSFRYNQQTNQLEPVGTGAPAGVPGAPAARGATGAGPQFTQAAPGQQQIQADLENVRKVGDQVGTNRDINRRILSLTQQTSTGPGTNFVHQVAAAAGLPSGASYQELGAFLDRQAAMASRAMDLPETNAGLDTATRFTGNTQYDNQVIRDKTKFVDALNTGAGAYRAGLDRVVGTGANPNYNAYQQYRSTWAQNYDPEVFAYQNAVQNGDKAEMARIEADEGRRGMGQLRTKRQVLMSLVNGQQ